MKKILRISLKVLIGIIIILGLSFLIFYIGTSREYEVAKTVEQDPTIPHIKIGTTIFHAETFGNDSNEVVIVVHGGPGNDYRYLLSLKALADNYFVVFYDQRGTGLSPRVAVEELTLDTMLADLGNIVDFYSPERKVNLIAHSWGAMLTSGYLAKHPQRVHKAVLAEPGMLTSEKAEEFIKKFQPKINFPMFYHMGTCWFQSLHVKGPDKQAGSDYFMSAIAMTADPELFKQHPFSKYFCESTIENASLEYWRYSFLSSTAIQRSGIDEKGNMQIDLVSGLENFTDKVLFLSGECNSIIGPAFQKDHMAYFPNAEMVVIENAGHTMLGEKPEESQQIIREYFLEK